MTNVLPLPLILTRPGVIRWAAERADGARSLTWRAEGHVNKKGEENIYFGTRQTMGDMKLSLHPDWWGYGYTDEFATARGLDPQNRHLSRFNPRLREVATGWARAAVVVSPSTYFAPGLAVHPSKPVQLYTAPTPPLHREWHLFIGEPGIPAPPLLVLSMSDG